MLCRRPLSKRGPTRMAGFALIPMSVVGSKPLPPHPVFEPRIGAIAPTTAIRASAVSSPDAGATPPSERGRIHPPRELKCTQYFHHWRRRTAPGHATCLEQRPISVFRSRGPVFACHVGSARQQASRVSFSRKATKYIRLRSCHVGFARQAPF
ncbi:hypothetical protein EV126DRAFT_207918 [Verticillium dahliae]|nr:hypothetical protein EV126DRAFT_207918 [Verticillium dahliae]